MVLKCSMQWAEWPLVQDLEQGFMEKKAKQIKDSQAVFDDERAKEAEEFNYMKIL